MLNLKLDFTIQTETHFQKSDFIRISNQILAIHLWCKLRHIINEVSFIDVSLFIYFILFIYFC